MDMRKLVEANLRRVRTEKGLTQEKLSDLSGFTQQYLSTVESGIANPTIVTIYEIAAAMGGSYTELLMPPTRRSRKWAWATALARRAFASRTRLKGPGFGP